MQRHAAWLGSLALVLAVHAALWCWFDRATPPVAAPPADTGLAMAVDMTAASPPPAPPAPPVAAVPPPVAVPAPVMAAPDPVPVAAPKPEKPRHRAVPPPTEMASPAPSPPAPSAVATAAARPGPPVIPAPSSAMVAGWQDALRARLRQFRAYPPAAEARGEEGTALLHVVIGPAGEIEALSLARSSGFAVLDDAALAWIRRAAPLPRPAGAAAVSAVIPLRFNLDDAP